MAEVAREVVAALPEVGELLVDEVAEEAVWTEMLGVAAGVSTLFPLSQLSHSVDIDLGSLLQNLAFLNTAKSYKYLHQSMMFVVPTLCSYFEFRNCSSWQMRKTASPFLEGKYKWLNSSVVVNKGIVAVSPKA